MYAIVKYNANGKLITIGLAANEDVANTLAEHKRKKEPLIKFRVLPADKAPPLLPMVQEMN